MHAETTGREKIAEALKLLEEAAKDKKDELRDMVVDKYAHLKELFVDGDGALVARLTAAQQRALNAMRRAKDVGRERVERTASAVDEHVGEHPWAYIGGAALAALALGYVLGRGLGARSREDEG